MAISKTRYYSIVQDIGHQKKNFKNIEHRDLRKALETS